ncbi:tRNA lysidine(34) synthetase TilS [Mycoplasma phocoeninasale]|uniref:tRNA lysidine(34) synthetase TilS n=1 Tax=Mycoplasma phocoeninasale TaxID=2726117 RepID=UPI001967A1E8|nr:tRNA lysidine(34) synthetase TilS [Mycoplasma phocoeninasale]MBN0970451.1 tRNA lysidine(34) synthetase TilS [Mycoplasma phocoeninasale]
MNSFNIASARLKEKFAEYHIKTSERFLIGVSGGPDSMWLLNLVKDLDIIVAHVNYNKRSDCHYDEQLVKIFCYENNIKLEILSIKEKNLSGNFQDLARQQRYQFYKKIYAQYQCSYLLLAHQKDDFLETAIMQDKANRKPLYFGIRDYTTLDKMQIFRPMISLWWKSEIENFCQENSILFATDYTNEMPIYSRNKIRLALKNKSLIEKERKCSQYLIENQKLAKINNQIETTYLVWEQKGFDCDFLKSANFSLNFLVYYLINKKYSNIKLSTNKINSIIQFLLSDNRSKTFKLDENNYLVKKKNHLLFN